MVPKNLVAGSKVWVRVVRADAWPGTVTVEDGFGREHRTAAGGPYCVYDDEEGRGRLGLGGVILAAAGAGLYRVRLGDGLVVVARLGSSHQWERAA